MAPLAILCGLLTLSVGLTYVQYTQASPVLGIFNRWVRWGLFASALTVGGTVFLDNQRPAWLWAVTGILVWPLLETMYAWLAIKALSHSAMPLFPRFVVNHGGDAWPNQPRFIALRDWLRREKFQLVQSLKANLMESHLLRVSVYHNADAHIRLQVMFIPQPTGNVTACYVFSSQTQPGTRLVTDNIYLPYGGFYPENWEVERRPWTRLPEALLRRHRQRLAGHAESLVSFTDEPLEDLNHQQQLLERTNTDLGFLFPRNLHEEHGALTWEGRYRVWKEAWLLNYFGRPGRH